MYDTADDGTGNGNNGTPPATPKLNEVWEFIGVLSVEPTATVHLQRHTVADADADADASMGPPPDGGVAGAAADAVAALSMGIGGMGMGGLTEPEEELARHPPASLVPRLHCMRTCVCTV